MKPLASCVLYTFVDSAYLRGRDPVEIARQLCAGGSDLIQLRAKDWPVERVEAIARQILPVTSQYGVRLVINDHLEVARRIGAEFCHLGQEDFFDSGCRTISDLPNFPGDTMGKLRAESPFPEIGLSTHAPLQAERAIEAGAGYIAIGPVYPTGTKPSAKPVTLDYVRWAAENVKIPWFAIGGITLANLDDVLAAGARRICVVSAILNEANLTAACRAFRSRLTGQ